MRTKSRTYMKLLRVLVILFIVVVDVTTLQLIFGEQGGNYPLLDKFFVEEIIIIMQIILYFCFIKDLENWVHTGKFTKHRTKN